MRIGDLVFVVPEVPEIEDDYSVPVSPGGTTVENGVETVTVSAKRLPDYGKYLTIFAVILAVYLVLRKARD